jgi:hypothetical protein
MEVGSEGQDNGVFRTSPCMQPLNESVQNSTTRDMPTENCRFRRFSRSVPEVLG